MSMSLLALMTATVLCSFTAGLTFTFAVVVMPGIGALPDREYLRAFQVMDRVIQDNDPWFMLVWVGSVLALVLALILNLGDLAGVDRALLLAAAVAYLVGVQLPTVAVNVPLNNALQAHDLERLDPSAAQQARVAFEARWNRWNRFRTVLACTSVMLLVALLVRI